MFRDLTRKKQKLSTVECKEILNQEVRGVLAVNGDDGYPYAMLFVIINKNGDAVEIRITVLYIQTSLSSSMLFGAVMAAIRWVAPIIIPTIMNTPSIPMPIYRRLFTNSIGSNIEKHPPLYKEAKHQ